MIKTRFAPSPTGLLHVGGLRTALFAYLFAKKNGGQFFIRIEDTDRERFVEGGMENILRSLYWAGVIPDGGVMLDADHKTIIQKGDAGPYIQSQRLDIYKPYVEKLIADNNAYHCFCTKERLDNLRKTQEANKMAPGYDGYCRNFNKEEIQKKINAGEKYVVRMRMPKEGTTKFTDLVRGEVEFENSLIDDQVLLKSDGFPTYHLAVVVDDHLMGITHAIRAEEWLPSTPKHITLYKMFGWEAPQFAHLSLLVNEQKQKLSKRHGDVSVQDFRDKGYLPEALVNFIAFLGWNPGDEREIFSLSELEKEFSFERVGKPAAVFNYEKLNWFNGQYIKKMDTMALADLCVSVLKNEGVLKSKDVDMEWMEKVVLLAKDRLNKLTELPELVGFIFADRLEYEPSLLVWKKSDMNESKDRLEKLIKFLDDLVPESWTKELLEKEIVEWIKKNNFTVGEVLWPMRTALSGQKNSPGPFEIADVLGKEKTLNRLQTAKARL